jgi:hypothetical protein
MGYSFESARLVERERVRSWVMVTAGADQPGMRDRYDRFDGSDTITESISMNAYPSSLVRRLITMEYGYWFSLPEVN